MGRYVFYDCFALKQAQIGDNCALTAILESAFCSCKALEGIDLPAGITSIGTSAFLACKAITQIIIPGGHYHREQRIRDCINLETVTFHDCPNLEQVVVPESVNYIDNSFQGTDKLVLYVIPGGYAEEYAQEHNLNYEYATNLGHSVQANVKGPDGKTISSGYKVCWYQDDTDDYLGSGAKLRKVEEGIHLLCRVFLEEKLGCTYFQPDDVTYTVGNKDGSIDITLTAYGKIQISGTVKDTEGTPVADASLSLKQTYDGDYVKTLTVNMGENGTFTFEADKTKSELTVSADGFYDQYYAVGTGSDQAVIDVTLEKIPADKITMASVRVEVAVQEQDPVITFVVSAANLTFSVYNETKKKAITIFKVQYHFLVLRENTADAGDVIRISVTDGTRHNLRRRMCGPPWTIPDAEA